MFVYLKINWIKLNNYDQYTYSEKVMLTFFFKTQVKLNSEKLHNYAEVLNLLTQSMLLKDLRIFWILYLPSSVIKPVFIDLTTEAKEAKTTNQPEENEQCIARYGYYVIKKYINRCIQGKFLARRQKLVQKSLTWW